MRVLGLIMIFVGGFLMGFAVRGLIAPKPFRPDITSKFSESVNIVIGHDPDMPNTASRFSDGDGNCVISIKDRDNFEATKKSFTTKDFFTSSKE